MNYRASILLGALLAVGITACDPYENAKGSAPAISSVVLTEGSTPTEGTGAGSTWTVTGEDKTQNVIHILTTGTLDPASIQTTPTDCTPAGNWLTVTGPALTCTAGTPKWYSCYNPSSPSPTQGASIVLFQACEAPSVDAGWYDIAELAPGATYHLTGKVRGNGAEMPIDVTVVTHS